MCVWRVSNKFTLHSSRIKVQKELCVGVKANAVAFHLLFLPLESVFRIVRSLKIAFAYTQGDLFSFFIIFLAKKRLFMNRIGLLVNTQMRVKWLGRSSKDKHSLNGLRGTHTRTNNDYICVYACASSHAVNSQMERTKSTFTPSILNMTIEHVCGRPHIHKLNFFVAQPEFV